MSACDCETLREERWHEVYMTVLKAQLQPQGSYQTLAFGGAYAALDPEVAHVRAKSVADKAYPKPEPTP